MAIKVEDEHEQRYQDVTNDTQHALTSLSVREDRAVKALEHVIKNRYDDLFKYVGLRAPLVKGVVVSERLRRVRAALLPASKGDLPRGRAG